MKLVLAEPKYLKDSISIISELVNEVNINIDDDKIEIIAMDPANVAMVIFKLLGSAFIEYEVDKPINISVNLDNLKQILRRAKPSDTLTLSLSNDSSRLVVRLSGESTRTFNLALIDIEDREQKIPDLKFPLTIEIPTMIFDEAIEDMDIIAESVTLTAEVNRLMIKAESKLNTANVEINNGEDMSIKMSGKDKITARYSIDYLKKMIKGSKLTDTVILQFDKEYPLKAEYKVRDKMDLTFILAPRVSND